MNTLGIIILIIYIIGVIFNMFTSKCVIRIYNYDEGSYANFITLLFLWPVVVFQIIISIFFIFGSWFSWIIYGIILLIEKYEGTN